MQPTAARFAARTAIPSMQWLSKFKPRYRPTAYFYWCRLSVVISRIFESVCLFVCLFVRSITQKTNDPKVFKLDVQISLGYPWDILQVVWFWGWKVKGQRYGLWLTAIRRGFELSECLLVNIICPCDCNKWHCSSQSAQMLLQSSRRSSVQLWRRQSHLYAV